MKNIMKNIIYSILLFLGIFSFTSCKKKDLHKVSFEIKFLDSPKTGYSNSIEFSVFPTDGKTPNLDRMNIPQVWRYDYMGLKKGDVVKFSVRGQLSYYFEMRVFIDDSEVSYMKVRVSDDTYYADHVEERNGRNDVNEDMGYIEFKY